MARREYTLIKNARLLDFENKRTVIKDILIKNSTVGKHAVVEKIAKPIQKDDADIYNAKNKLAIPGFVDLYTHLCEPGYEYREDISTGTLAALYGGYCALLCTPDTNPVADNPGTLDYINKIASQSSYCRVLPSAALSIQQKGRELCDYDSLSAHGAVAFTDGINCSLDDANMRNAMKKCAQRDYLIILRPALNPAYSDAPVNEGRASGILGVKGIPNSAEDISVARNLILAEETNCRIHISTVSTKGSIRLIREAKQRGVRVSCSTSPHYFSFSDDDVVFFGTKAKVYPPLRSRSDVEAVIEGLADGTIDCIATDHTPCSPYEKGRDLNKSRYGVIGLQTAFSAAVTYLVIPGHIDMFRLVSLMSYNPAKILGINTGITEGKRLNINIVSLDDDFIVTNSYLKSKSLNSPFIGLSLRGKIEASFMF